MQPIARVGDTHICPKHGRNKIISGGTSVIDGRPVARIGDLCACGGLIIEGSSQSTDGGKPVAYLGCKTSCGGIITTGAPNGKVAP